MVKFSNHFIAVMVLSFNFFMLGSGDIDVSGNVEDTEIYLNGSRIYGNGILASNNIFLTCNTFEFTGTIDCDGECIISCKEGFDFNMFNRKGAGTFTVINSTHAPLEPRAVSPRTNTYLKKIALIGASSSVFVLVPALYYLRKYYASGVSPKEKSIIK